MRTKENTFLFCFLFLSIGFSAGDQESRIRLVGGKNPTEGRVEIFHDGVWGTVCDDQWDMNVANVACHQLDFSGAVEFLSSSVFGAGKGTIWMDDLSCTGVEASLLHCTFHGWGVNNCGHSEDVGVRCKNESRWNSVQEYDLIHREGLSHQLGALFDSERDCDLNISVMADNLTLNTVCAHSLILSLNPDLRRYQPDFSSLTVQTTSNCSQHAHTFVRYFYTRKLQVQISSAACILKMASDWGLTDFQSETINIIHQLLSEDPTFQSHISIYELALSTGNEALLEMCIRYLAWNCEALIHSPAWKYLPFDLVKELLSRSDLIVSHETVLLNGLEKWTAAQGDTAIPEVLLKLIRFPMIPAEHLYGLNSSQYLNGKFQGFQFNALPDIVLLNNVTMEQNNYRPRIYTGSPWSFTFNYYNISPSESLKCPGPCGQVHYNLTSDFQTPVHYSAYFTFNYVDWKTSIALSSNEECNSTLPTVSLMMKEKDRDLNRETMKRIFYRNKLVIECEGRFVVDVDDFGNDFGENFVYTKSSAKHISECQSRFFSYRVVVRPQYATD